MVRTLQLVPTAHVFRTNASRLEAARQVVLSMLRPIDEAIEVTPFPPGDGDAGDTYLERTAMATLQVTSANVREVAAELNLQIAEARRRAVVCDRYAEAVRRYYHSSDPRRMFPSPPASWADHGW